MSIAVLFCGVQGESWWGRAFEIHGAFRCPLAPSSLPSFSIEGEGRSSSDSPGTRPLAELLKGASTHDIRTSVGRGRGKREIAQFGHEIITEQSKLFSDVINGNL